MLPVSVLAPVLLRVVHKPTYGVVRSKRAAEAIFVVGFPMSHVVSARSWSGRTLGLQSRLQGVICVLLLARMRGVVRKNQETGRSSGRGIQLAERPTQRRRGDYPWQHWQAGGWHVIRQGREFDCTVEGMRSTLFTRAKRDDIAIEVIRNPQAPQIASSRSRLHLAFCFYPGRAYADGPEPAPRDDVDLRTAMHTTTRAGRPTGESRLQLD